MVGVALSGSPFSLSPRGFVDLGDLGINLGLNTVVVSLFFWQHINAY